MAKYPFSAVSFVQISFQTTHFDFLQPGDDDLSYVCFISRGPQASSSGHPDRRLARKVMAAATSLCLCIMYRGDLSEEGCEHCIYNLCGPGEHCIYNLCGPGEHCIYNLCGPGEHCIYNLCGPGEHCIYNLKWLFVHWYRPGKEGSNVL